MLSKLNMSYHSKPDSHIRYKVDVVLELSNYTTKKKLEDAIDVDTSDKSAKVFHSFKAIVDKLTFFKFV